MKRTIDREIKDILSNATNGFKTFNLTIIPQQRDKSKLDTSHDQQDNSIRKSKVIDGVTKKIPIHFVINFLNNKVINNITFFLLRHTHMVDEFLDKNNIINCTIIGMKLLCIWLTISLSIRLRRITKTFETNL